MARTLEVFDSELGAEEAPILWARELTVVKGRRIKQRVHLAGGFRKTSLLSPVNSQPLVCTDLDP